MPRFAANLGFTPLQPMKPSTPMGTIPNAVLMPAVINNTSTNSTTGVLPGDVPAAQFDWDSSGLVNPLHGKRLWVINCNKLHALGLTHK